MSEHKKLGKVPTSFDGHALVSVALEKNPRLSGQEWYDRFIAELKAYPSDIPFPGYIYKVAKRASGLEERDAAAIRK